MVFANPDHLIDFIGNNLVAKGSIQTTTHYINPTSSLFDAVSSMIKCHNYDDVHSFFAERSLQSLQGKKLDIYLHDLVIASLLTILQFKWPVIYTQYSFRMFSVLAKLRQSIITQYKLKILNHTGPAGDFIETCITIRVLIY